MTNGSAPSQPTAPKKPAAVLPRSESFNSIGKNFAKATRPEFSAFADWVERNGQASAAQQAALQEEGVLLATARQQALKGLIQNDPKLALELAVPLSERAKLPARVEKLLEKRIQGTGKLIVWGAIPFKGQLLNGPPITRSLMMEGHEYSAFTYGASSSLPTTESIQVDGIEVLNSVALVDVASLEAWGDASFGTSTVVNKPQANWTRGEKKLLLIRVDYSDLPGVPTLPDQTTPITPAVAVDLFTQVDGVNTFYVQSSYNQTSFNVQLSDVTPLYRMPNTALYYGGGDSTQPFSGTLFEAAQTAAAAGGYDLSQYDRIGIISGNLASVPGSTVSFSGLGQVDGPIFLTSGEYDFRVVAHELGHTFGLYHANWWKPAGNTVIGTDTELGYNFQTGEATQVSQEYQDRYDVMGIEGDIHHQFNPWFKSLLNWLPDAAVGNVVTSGTYRVYRFDDPNVNLASNKLVLKVSRDFTRDFWVSYRKQPYGVADSNIGSGAYITFSYFVNQPSDLLACNHTGLDIKAPTLEVGQSLVDSSAGVTLKTVGMGGSTPNEYIDVQITLEPRVAFSTNFVAAETTQGVANVVVDRQGGTSGVTSVNYSVVDGSAIAGTHFTGTGGTLTWADGDANSKTLSFPILSYAASEGSLNFSVELSGITNGVLINPKTVQVWLMPPGAADPGYVSGAIPAVASAALQTDGKTLVAGSILSAGSGSNKLSRYGRVLADGSRDYSFHSLDGPNGDAKVIRVQADGKILVGGGFSNVNNSSPARPWLVRLLSDGTIDPSFDAPILDGAVLDLAIQPDGRIVIVGGFQNVNGQRCVGLCRLMPNGSLDFGFSDSNYQLATLLEMRSVVLDHFSNGNGVRILAAGSIILSNQGGLTPEQKSGIIRLNSDGSIDSSFNIGSGAHAKGAPGSNNQVFALAIQPDGKILAGGNFTSFGTSKQKFLVRLNSDGTPDLSFAPSITGSDYVEVSTIAVQPDGKVAFSGFFQKANGQLNQNLLRVSADGSPDPTWDNGIDDFNGSVSNLSTLLLRPDGRLLAGSLSHNRIRTGAGYLLTLFTGITDQYGSVCFPAATHSVLPGNTLVVNVQRINGSAGAVKVDYSTQSGTALAGTDYLTSAGTLTWAAGDASSKTFTVTCPPGATLGRQFTINLGLPSGGLFLAAPCATTVTIAP